MRAVLDIGFVAGLVSLGLAVLAWLWWLGRPAHFVLGVFPITLLFFTQTVGPALWQMLAGFRQMAATSTSSRQQVALMCLGVARPLWLATLAFICALATAALLQGLLRHRPKPAASIADRGLSIWGRWGGWLLIVSSLLIVPVAILVYRAERIAMVTMLATDASPSELSGIATAFAGAGVPLGEAIGDQLKFLVPASTQLSHLLLGLSIANILVIAFRRAPQSPTRYSWVAFGTACAAGVWALIRLGADIRWFAGAIR